MIINWIILLGLCILALPPLFTFLSRYKKRPGITAENIERGPSGSTFSQSQLTKDLRAEVLHLLALRQKIQAIKLYRQQTGCGLREAKQAVDSIEKEQQHPILFQSQGTYTTLESGTIDQTALRAEVLHLLASHQKIQAIKLYRVQTGYGLREAKQAVDALEKKQYSDPKW
jgi:ribosomal protein L7/L12